MASEHPRFVQVQVRGVAVEGASKRLVLLLTDPGGRLLLPIPLSSAEARGLARLLKGGRIGRPSSHDLLSATIRALGARLIRVDLRGVEGEDFKADVILLDSRARRVRLDARAVDALALALQCAAPVRAARAVLEAAKLPAEGPTAPRPPLAVDAADTAGRARLMARLADLAPEDLANC